MTTNLDHIRNFSIVAHIDHGKSTLADRILERTGAVSAREMRDQYLDKLEIERERGITVKAQAVRLAYRARDGRTYAFNLIDTPGHVDFAYEVSRSLAACEGALLLVDAAQGVEAQTLANAYLAVEHELDIVSVINKVDLPTARPDEARRQLEDVVGIDASDAILCSAKTGLGVDEILEAVVARIRPPAVPDTDRLRALIFDSTFDVYRGVVVFCAVRSGVLRRGDPILLMASGGRYEVLEVGTFEPEMRPRDALGPGEVGYFISGIKGLRSVRIGDTVTHAQRRAEKALPGYREFKPVVYAGFYPVDADAYDDLREAIEKLKLNDASFQCEPETSQALGFGFRCGFLGLLHMEIVQQRLEREFETSLITTFPSVVYRIHHCDGSVAAVANPAQMPPVNEIEAIEEPVVDVTILAPASSLGNVLKLCEGKRGIQRSLTFPRENCAMLVYRMPLAEIIVDFHDRLKSMTQGYASFNYEPAGYQVSDIVKLDILINGDPMDALAVLVHRDDAVTRGRQMAEKLKVAIPRHQFRIPIQAAVGGKIVARENISALRKDVTAKCYGGDVTRKRKLLEKQKAGKRRMKQFGAVTVPQEAFLAVLKAEM
ncbi:MAG: elongation factor 4 [Planctomycetes bacterium]|nr:elongation factor 4 [Planctomycetota bacterium]